MGMRSERSLYRLAGVAGVAFVMLFVASGLVGTSELSGVDQTGEAIARDLLENRHGGLRASVALLSVAVIAGFWFLGLLHYRLAGRWRSPEIWAALGGGLGVLTVVMALGVVLSAALTVDSLANDPETAKTLWLLEQGTWTLMSGPLATFVLGLSVGAIRDGDPSRLLGWAGLAVTAVLLANTWLGMGSPVVLGFVWTFVVALTLAIRLPVAENTSTRSEH